ncbi:ATP-dependent helicase [Acholeplasma vituli]|uniref:DNA 3'-5' helicase n=1 Tax=Paracholeplasma vituli TaxID=69473 RepID=A0ABT2Q040_9MOLU|nr:ATP-dependent helicase [Paracholeplasma vituli]MCU0105337.1 ATP-dependent helicase [Paracholeplasma vituli]
MLNNNQSEAVITQHKRVFVVSGADTGKTTVIFNRINQLIENKVDSCSILFISFTRRTISDIKMKFNQCADNPVIKTFHGLAFSTLSTTFSKQLVNHQSDLFMDFDQPTLTQILVKKQEFKIMNVSTKPKTGYQMILDENNLFDYPDLEIDYLSYLKDINHQKTIQNQYKYIFVDEAQDMSKIQVEILNLMVNEDTHLFFVGDPDQSIYGFRGSIPNQVRILIKLFKCHTYTLVDCYRCTKSVLEVANKLIAHNTKRVKKDLVPHQKHLGLVEYHQFSNTKKEALFVLSKIREFLHQKMALTDMVILVRNHYMSNDIKTLLSEGYYNDIACMSIHQAKGLEFKIVFIMGIEDGPNTSRRVIEEERRLMFVAVTRAKTHLIMTSPSETRVPRFIKEMKMIIIKHKGELSNVI